jgi:type VI secretion system secreted protein VgrG
VKGGQSLRVAVDDGTAVGGNRTLTVQQDRVTLTGAEHVEEVGGSQAITVGASQTVLVGAASAVTVGAAAALTVGGGYLVTVGGVHNTAVGAARLEQVGGARTSAVFGSQDESVGKDHAARVGGDFTIDVAEGVETAADKDQKEELDAKAGLEAKQAAAWLMKSLKVEADDLKIVVGGKLLLRMQKSGDVTFAASKLTVDASGAITAKGSQVKKEAGSGPSSSSASVAEAQKLEKADKSVQVSFKHADGSSALVGLAFELTLPDGSKKKGDVAASGVAFGGVKPGSCKLAFTALDEPEG